jgi:Tfp pilus assembly protein PilF
MLRRFFFCVLLTASCTTTVLAQANPEEQLTVRVTYDDDDRTALANLRVELLSIYGSSIETRTTDGLGAVVFSRLRPAKYKLRVSGDGVITTETGELDMSDSGPNLTEYVRVHRIPLPADGPGVSSVSVMELNIPAEAKKEFDKGTSKMEQKNWSEAKNHLELAIAIYPKYALAQNNLAVTYLKLGQGASAVESFRAALQLDEHLFQANVYVGHFYYDNKDYKQAEPYLLRAASGEPRNPQLLMALANTQMQNGETDQALVNAQKVHSLPDHKKFAIAHLIAADILSDRGDKQQVRIEYKQFLREDPDSPFAPRVKDALAKLEAAPK